MKKVVSLGLAFSLALGGVLPTLSVEPSKVEASSYEFTKEQQEALNYINDIRKKIGLKPVTLNPFLIKAAENHAKYLDVNNIFSSGVDGHSETVGKTGYTGKNVGERIKSVGGSQTLASNSAEGIAYNVSSINKGIDLLMDLPLHRTSLVDPQLSSVGVAIVDNIVVLTYYFLEFGTNPEESIYPYDGQTNVGLEFVGKTERPNPLEEFKVEKSGYVISFSPSSSNVVPDNVVGKLFDSKGKEVPVFFKEDALSFTYFLFPKSPLLKNEKYTVKFTYTPESVMD